MSLLHFDLLEEQARRRKKKSRKKPQNVMFSVETITPAAAAELAKSAAESHPRDTKAIAAYAQTMKAGGWVLNGMPIILDRNDRLLDGLQRLEACCEAGVAFDTVVARNVRADTLHTIDQHRRRSYAGVLETRGIAYAGSVMRTMSKLIRIENDALGRSNSPISWWRYDRVLAANPEVLEGTALAERARGSRLHSTPRPVLATMAIKAGKTRQLKAFLAGLQDPEAYPLDSPARMLALQLDIARDANAAVSVDKALALAILAFNDFCAEKKATGPYSWDPDYGGVKLDERGEPVNRKAMREQAPANLGLPTLDGYPGLEEGGYDIRGDADDFEGDLAELLKQAQDAGDQVQVEVQTITPSVAKAWLTNFNRRNRKIQVSHLRTIARDIVAGNWQVNAQPICFAGNLSDPDTAILLNGQHRLSACVEADVPIDVPVAFNVPSEAFSTYDIHRKRLHLPDKKRSSAKVDDRVLAAAARFQWRYDQGIPVSARVNPSTTELVQTMQAHPSLGEGYPLARRMKTLASAGVMTFFIHLVTSDRPDDAESFLKALETGENLTRGNPVLRARQEMIGERGGRSRKETLTLLLETWEAYKDWRDKSR